MSNYFRMIKDGEKLPKVTPDKIDREYIEKEFDKYIRKNLKEYKAEIEKEKDWDTRDTKKGSC